MAEQQNSLKIHRLPFTQVPNDLICSDKISVMAKALWCVFYSKPDNWTFYWREIESNFKEGRDAVRNGARQLEELGYLKKTQKKINSGKGMIFGGMEIELFPHPNHQTQPLSSNTENPYSRISDARQSDSIISNSSKTVTYKDLEDKDLSKKDLKDSSSFPTLEEAKKFAEEEELKIDVEKWWNFSKQEQIKNWRKAIVAWSMKAENQIAEMAVSANNETNNFKISRLTEIKAELCRLCFTSQSNFEKDVGILIEEKGIIQLKTSKTFKIERFKDFLISNKIEIK